jgi:hypothetical protein
MPNLEELLARVTTTPGRSKCWASRLSGAAQEFVTALEELEAQDPNAINNAEVARILQAEFGINIRGETVRAHLSKGCRCGR